MPRETNKATLCPSTSSTVFFSSNNDERFNTPSDSSVSDISGVESSYTSPKRLKPELKNHSYKFSGNENTNELEGEAFLGSGFKTEADNAFNDQFTPACRTTYVSNKRNVNFEENPVGQLLDFPTSKNESCGLYYSTSASEISQNDEDIGVEIPGKDELHCCQTTLIDNDRPSTSQYSETESDIEFNEVVNFTPMEGMDKERRDPKSFEKKFVSGNFEEHTLLNSESGHYSGCNHSSRLNVSKNPHLNGDLHKSSEDEFNEPLNQISSLESLAINVEKGDTDYLYLSPREELSDSSCSSEGLVNNSCENDLNIEEVIYRDDESTDEDESLPPPDPKRKKIGSKACEILDSRRIGIKVPKLYIWSLSDKPFSVIDGLCTKSLYPLGDDVDTPESLSSSSINSQTEQKEDPTFDNDTMLTDLLDIGGPEVEKEASGYNEFTNKGLLDRPKGSLSSFRERNNCFQETNAHYNLNISKFRRSAAYCVSEDQIGVLYD
ncbi:hypothetical protein SMKI_04G4330 [Saccharomyces mikatae IFO 1815]|uniref:Uncharacterized protein n=1 Tax=Saccharomyces mikatae IFO 1815 TaxID=226126 RepID=A0AA35IX38_SACMI|nr:uncharacterized protein SMKI_04G4330 [Saccharomyces mikatae IFO 1815]CAI4038093.1 hypothetical protein SMKI_04G4330 [Saccharomyces mikatae IFO 1815]